MDRSGTRESSGLPRADIQNFYEFCYARAFRDMTQRSDTVKKLILLATALVLLTSTYHSQKFLNRQRADLGLTRVTPLENAPPVLAFTTVALGGFRGLIANALWMRAADLQESGQYFEMVQLSDWITKLQPHFALIWAHQAWNMSYNISIKFDDPRDRWPWVLHGVELLRDEGLHYNPKSPLIYRELSWHFQHKIGQNLDDAHEYYKHVWAQEMQDVLSSGVTNFANFRPNFDELLAEEPTPEVKARLTTLREKYKMDPRRMKEADELYGPLEWRLPETHAIYWAYIGLQECKDAKDEDLVQLRRSIFQSMQLAFMRGRMIFPVPDKFEFTYAPKVLMIDKVNAAYEEMLEAEPNQKRSLETAHRNFLKTAVYFLDAYNHGASAKAWYNYLQDHYPDAILTAEQVAQKQENPNITFPRKSLEEYTLERINEEIEDGGIDRTKAVIEGYLQRAYGSLAVGEDGLATSHFRRAQLVWNAYQQRLGNLAQGRVGLPDLEVMKTEVLRQVLDPERGLQSPLDAQLRTKLGMPAGTNTVNRPVPQGTQAPGSSNTSSAQPR